MKPFETAKDLHEAQLELLTAAYSQARAYFNLVIVGGYAAFFALWKLTEDHLTPKQKLWSALLIGSSLVCFIVWEISQMILTSISLLSVARAVADPENFPRLIAEHSQTEGKRMRTIGKIWALVLLFTVGAALAGAGVLMYAFATGLWKLYS